jgi:hypothetical protein
MLPRRLALNSVFCVRVLLTHAFKHLLLKEDTLDLLYLLHHLLVAVDVHHIDTLLFDAAS